MINNYWVELLKIGKRDWNFDFDLKEYCEHLLSKTTIDYQRHYCNSPRHLEVSTFEYMRKYGIFSEFGIASSYHELDPKPVELKPLTRLDEGEEQCTK